MTVSRTGGPRYPVLDSPVGIQLCPGAPGKLQNCRCQWLQAGNIFPANTEQFPAGSSNDYCAAFVMADAPGTASRAAEIKPAVEDATAMVCLASLSSCPATATGELTRSSGFSCYA